MTAKTNAQLKREERERKRSVGLVPKEVWIRPEYAQELKQIELQFREKRASCEMRKK